MRNEAKTKRILLIKKKDLGCFIINELLLLLNNLTCQQVRNKVENNNVEIIQCQLVEFYFLVFGF